MKTIIILILSWLIPVRAKCSVCGKGNWVTNVQAIFAYPGRPAISCGAFEKVAKESDIVPEDVCPLLPALEEIKPCGCKSKDDGCSICGSQTLIVYDIDAIVKNPVDQSDISCKDLEIKGKAGDLGHDCSVVTSDVREKCGCAKLEEIDTSGYEGQVSAEIVAPDSLSAGAIVGIMAGVVAFGGILIAAIIFIAGKRKMKRSEGTVVVSPPSSAFSASHPSQDDPEVI
mmetsp:Transcript_18524/g.27997  ORF Transcript_18524/g.27997 Transcript_18524/m.27997 type:complete len:228 (+) Transcript_18524:107-790(+)